MDEVCEAQTHTVVLMSSSQVGKTEVILNALGFYIHQDPAPILVVEPRVEDAKALSKDRIAPMVRDSPVLTGLLPPPRTRDSGNTVLHKTFPGGHLTLGGANSPAGLAMRPIRIALFDEVDRYPPSAGSEGDPVALGTKRTTTFWNRKVIMCSSPTEEGTSRIAEAYAQSDQRRYFVRCRHCDHQQVLKWAQVRWEKDEQGKHLPLTARYHCERCDEPWTDGERWAAIQKGEWIAEAEYRGVAGFHISELYSPWKRLSETASDFLDAKDNPERLRAWINTALGETYKESGEAPDHERLYERREDYRRGVVPARACILTAGVDVQSDRLEVEIVAWGRGLESWSVDYRVFHGDPAHDAVWKDVKDLLSENIPHELGSQCKIARMAIDTGYETHRVYDWKRRNPDRRVLLVDGRANLAQPLGQKSLVDINAQGRKYKKGVSLWPVGVSHLKNELYGWLRLPMPEDGAPTDRYCHFPLYDKEFFQQLTAEHLQTRLVKGYRRREWVKTRARNEALDCRVYARAAAAHMGIDNWRAHRWDELEIMLGSRPAEPPPEQRLTEAERLALPPAPQPADPSPQRPRPVARRRRIVRSSYMD